MKQREPPWDTLKQLTYHLAPEEGRLSLSRPFPGPPPSGGGGAAIADDRGRLI